MLRQRYHQLNNVLSKSDDSVLGECLDSTLLDSFEAKNSVECLEKCQKMEGCEWFTFIHGSGICNVLSGSKS